MNIQGFVYTVYLLLYYYRTTEQWEAFGENYRAVITSGYLIILSQGKVRPEK